MWGDSKREDHCFWEPKMAAPAATAAPPEPAATVTRVTTGTTVTTAASKKHGGNSKRGCLAAEHCRENGESWVSGGSHQG